MSIYRGPIIVKNGLVFGLDFSDPTSYPTSGSVAYDISSYNDPSTLLSGSYYSSANGGIVIFDGVNDTINCGPATFLTSSLTGLTVEVICLPISKSSAILMENGTSFTTNTFYLAQENANNFTFEIYGGSGVGYDVVYSSFVYQTGSWYHLVGVWNSGSRVSMYSNGINCSGTQQGALQGSVRNGNTNLFIGTRAGTTVQFSGSIGFCRIYNRALSSSEIYKNYIATRTRFGI